MPPKSTSPIQTNVDKRKSSYKSLSPKTRAVFGIGLMAWASLGMMISPQVEKTLGMVPSEQEKEELERKLALRVEKVEKSR